MSLSRREFITKTAQAAGGIGLVGGGCAHVSSRQLTGQVMSVGGPVHPAELGVTLPHEHVLVDFIGASQVNRGRYSADEVFDVVLPHLKRIRGLGCGTLVECTPACLGRDPLLLRRLSQASGLRLLTNTGYYGAADNKFLPAHAFTESAAQLAARWTAEWRYGIEGTDIRPGFIKIGVGAGKLSEVHRKLALAAALTHLETGLAITSHTGNGEAVLDQLAVLKQAGVRAEAFIWVHAQAEPNRDLHVRAAEAGAWVEFDGLNGTTVEQHVQLTQNLRQRGLLGRVLVSHDAGWFHVGEPRGGEFRPFDTLFTQFLPALRAAGFASVELRQLTETNPQTAFTLRQRESQRDSGR